MKKEYIIIYKLFLDDQRDHSAVKIRSYKTAKDWEKLTQRDKKRQKLVVRILNNKKIHLGGEVACDGLGMIQYPRD
ncbi:MAG: hypothetical protein AB1643_02735 [Patescibacteria group bacterium]